VTEEAASARNTAEAPKNVTVGEHVMEEVDTAQEAAARDRLSREVK
jgi:hypothetical protein